MRLAPFPGNCGIQVLYGVSEIDSWNKGYDEEMRECIQEAKGSTRCRWLLASINDYQKENDIGRRLEQHSFSLVTPPEGRVNNNSGNRIYLYMLDLRSKSLADKIRGWFK